MSKRKKTSKDYKICTIAVTFSIEMDTESAASFLEEEAFHAKYAFLKSNGELCKNVKVNYTSSQIDGDYAESFTTLKRGVSLVSNNMKTFLPKLHKWRSWDYAYTVDVLVAFLEEQAKDIKNDKWHLHANRRYYQCKYAIHLLKKVYLDDDAGYCNDKTIDYLQSFTVADRVKHGLGIAIAFRHDGISDRIYDGMYRAAIKRIDKENKERSEFAWNYINKHLNQWWT